MVRYVKDGAYTIKVEDADTVDETGRQLDDSEILEAARQAEAIKEIDFTDTNFILQNLNLAMPNYKDDRTFMLQGRKDLVEIICSQVCFFCYCALLGLETKLVSPTILVIGDGFIGSNVMHALHSHGFGSAIKLYTRSDSRAKEWVTNGIRADSSIMDLLAGQRPDIIIPCVENASFTALCKHFTEFNIVTEGTFIITPTFGFQRKKICNALHCFNVFRTFVEPHEIVRNHKLKLRSSKMDLLSMLLKGEVPLDSLKDKDDASERSGDISALSSPARTPMQSSLKKSRSGLSTTGDREGTANTGVIRRSVNWGDDFEGTLVPDPEGSLDGVEDEEAMKGVAEIDVEEEPEEVDLEHEKSAHARGARLLATRLHTVRHLIYLLENFYFIHGMLHHEARQNALNVIFGYHEAPDGSVTTAEEVAEGSASVASAPLTCSTIASGAHPFSDWPASSVAVNAATQPSAPGVAGSQPPPLQRTATTPNGSLTNNSSVTSPPVPQKVVRPHHPVDVHNIIRREKMPRKVRAHFEAMLDETLMTVGKSYQKEFSKMFKLSELGQMYRDYAPDHQRQLDQMSFLMNHRSMSVIGTADTLGVRHVARHDKHAKTMYDADFILDTIFGADDDIEGFEGPGFDLIREIERKNRKPRRNLTRSRSYLEQIATAYNNPLAGDFGDEPDYAHDDKQTISEEMARMVKQMHQKEKEAERRNHQYMHEHGGEGNGLGAEEIGMRIFQKHSEFSRDMHLKIETEATSSQRHHSYVPPSKTLVEKQRAADANALKAFDS